MKKEKFTYEKSGVNINAADNFVKFISSISTKNKGKKKFQNIGGFGSISSIPKDIKKPKIVACTDGVGTKVEIANTLNKFDTIGIDLVAMSVNDLIVQGAKPLLFLDYISINKIDLKKLKSILKGIVKGCKISNCELVGGETAEMPGTYAKGKFDIAGFAVGIQFICLAGFMKILSSKFIKQFNGKIINIHPSLLPRYKGLNTHSRAIQNKDKFTGCSVHYVTEKLDSGKIIIQKKIKILKKDTPKSLAKKVLKHEHKLYPKAILKIFN